jgi:hypothetical protein
MTNDHGEKPIETTTDWHTTASKQDKRKAYQDKVSAFIEKNNQNDPQEPKIEIKAPTTTNRAPTAYSTFITRINFKIIPQKITTALSVLYNVIRIMAAISAADNQARITATDHEGNEIVFYGAKANPPDNKETQEFIKQFTQEPRITNRNELVGLITLRSEISFREIKKNASTQQILNELPRIFLTQNTLSVVTPVLVGFFVNVYPRPDKPEAFEGYLDAIIKNRDETLEYQIDFGPVWAKNKKMSVYKLMTAQEDKERLRSIMAETNGGDNETQYVCASEYYSLSDEDKTKIVASQLDFMNNTRSIFIPGIKTVLCNLLLDEMTGDDDDINNGDEDTLADWLFQRETGAGERMFTRIYEARNGLVELYVKPQHHKEAIDWARLATSEIAKELSDRSMKEIFVDVEDATNQLATQPDWKPHTLSQRVEHLKPSESPQQTRRRQPVAISYATTNTEKKVTEKKKNAKVKKDTTANNSKAVGTQATVKSTTNLAWMIPGTIDSAPQSEAKEHSKTVSKLGSNKYKIAHAAQDERMDHFEASIEAMAKASTNMKDDPRIGRLEEAMAALIKATSAKTDDPRIDKLESSIEAIAQSQHNTVEAIKQVIEGQGETKAFVRSLTEKVRYNKKQADEDHKLMTEAMKSFHDSLVQSQTMINALQRVSESPIRKKRATMQPGTNSDDYSDEESSFNSTKMGPLSAVSHPDATFQSDANMDNMKGAADEN